MSTIKIKHVHIFDFVKGGDCDNCDMRDYCYEADDEECEGGTLGHYEEIDEEIDQIQEDETETANSVSCGA